MGLGFFLGKISIVKSQAMLWPRDWQWALHCLWLPATQRELTATKGKFREVQFIDGSTHPFTSL